MEMTPERTLLPKAPPLWAWEGRRQLVSAGELGPEGLAGVSQPRGSRVC